ncbi:phage integrase family protein [Burkholderia gladioli]|uniref:phage integrase family protein n=1 Tax=Burkholderia gladioli TaxID=28095 RepID=UPI001FC8A67B|nr:phage integrase family protein [Burkholderia gladioli]
MSLLRLTHAHFALYRAYLEGFEEQRLHAHYGAPGADVRITRRTLATLRDTLTIAARRAGDIDAVHLLRLRPGSLPAEAHAGAGQGEPGAAPVPPTLDAFRDQVDPDHVYSERDLLALYLEQFPPVRSPTIDRKVARNRRLRERQDAALARMEAPRPDHLLKGWFAPAVVERLAAAGATSFDQLLALIRRRRQRWYTAVPRLGAVGAARIVAFVDQHAESLGCLSPLAMTPRRQLPARRAAPGRGRAVRRRAARGAARAGRARRLRTAALWSTCTSPSAWCRSGRGARSWPGARACRARGAHGDRTHVDPRGRHGAAGTVRDGRCLLSPSGRCDGSERADGRAASLHLRELRVG